MTTSSQNKQARIIGVDGRELMPNTITGFGRFLSNFLEAQVTRLSQHTFIIYGNQQTQYPTPHDRFVFKTIVETKTMWWDQVSIVKALKNDKVDVFFTPYDKTPLRAPCPIVMTIHDLLYQYVSDLTGLRRYLYNALYRIQRGAMARRSASVLTVSQHSKRDICKYYGLSPSKVEITYNAVSDRFNPQIADADVERVKRKYGIEKPYILNINNFKPHKNPKALLKAFSKLSQGLQDKYMLVMGGKHHPVYTPALTDAISEHDLCEKILLPGIIADEDLPALYKGAELFAISSTYEGFGIPPIEAMACGTPVVSSNATSLPEVIGNAGLLVSPNDIDGYANAFESVLSSDTLREELAQKGLEQIKHFTPEKVASRILQVLESV